MNPTFPEGCPAVVPADPGRPRRTGLRARACGAIAWIMGAAVMVAALGADSGGTGALRQRAQTHWSFQPLSPPVPKPVTGSDRSDSALDSFLESRLRARGLSLGPPADSATRLRRMSLVLTGLPPTSEDLEAFAADTRPEATERWIERLLASPAYGVRWAQHWLDAVGYADSNGYFNADSDRPLAHRYRDHVIRSINGDKPFDRWVREQLAGDELAGWKPGDPVTPEIRDLLEATHFLRNGQDGTGESDGNPDEVRVDRYYALEACQQIIGSSLLGMTVQCAKCHDHKFEPFTQRDYYAMQAFFHPAFPIDDWVKPNDRVVEAPLPGEQEAWSAAERRWEQGESESRAELTQWISRNEPSWEPLWRDDFESDSSLPSGWSNTAPGDEDPAGSPPVTLGGLTAPAARVTNGVLQLIEGGGTGDRWLSTCRKFSWQPAAVGDWIQVAFELVSLRAPGQDRDSERIGYILAAHDFADRGPTPGGNLLIDGNPGGASAVHLDYPGSDSKSLGTIGGQGYRAGHRYGVRITRVDDHRFELQHRVDGLADGKPLTLSAADLPQGGFAFEFCCGRGFQVDRLHIRASPPAGSPERAAWEAYERRLQEQVRQHDQRLAALQAQRLPRPGRVAWVSDVRPEPRPVPLLQRGNPKTPGEAVAPAFPSFLDRGQNLPVAMPLPGRRTTGRRLAWGAVVDGPRQPPGRVAGAGDGPAGLAAMLGRGPGRHARQPGPQRGGTRSSGIVGVVGPRLRRFGMESQAPPPAHPRLPRLPAIEPAEAGRTGDRPRQSGVVALPGTPPRCRGHSRPDDRGRRASAPEIQRPLRADPASGRWRGPGRRRGPGGFGEIAVPPATSDAGADPDGQFRRPFGGLQLHPASPHHDAAPDPEPAQFGLRTPSVRDLARRLERDCGSSTSARIRRGFLLACGREPDAAELATSERFVRDQETLYAGQADAAPRAWTDFAQSLFLLNDCLYVR